MFESKIDGESRHRETETKSQRQANSIKHRGLHHTFFLLNRQFGKSKITACKVLFT